MRGCKPVIVAILISIMLAAIAGCSNSEEMPITLEQLNNTIKGMEEVVELTEAGKVHEGETIFWQVHPFFHEADPYLRKADPEFAQEIWDNVLRIEFEYFRRKSQPALIKEGLLNLELLPKVRTVLNLK